MVYRTTSINLRLRGVRGFTLIELLVSVGLSMILLSSIFLLISFSGRSFAALMNYVEMDQISRNTLDVMTTDIRQSDALTSYSAHEITLSYTNGIPLTYSYDQQAKTLTRQLQNQSTVLLTGCVFFNFSIFQRNPIEGSYDVYPTANLETCKMIQLDWTCTRSVFRADENTESVQSAKIVLRRQ